MKNLIEKSNRPKIVGNITDEAVQKYVDTKDFREVDRIQKSLLLGYQYDICF